MRRMTVAVRSWTACSRVPGPLSAIISAMTAASMVAARAARVTTGQHRLAVAAVAMVPACENDRTDGIWHAPSEYQAPRPPCECSCGSVGDLMDA